MKEYRFGADTENLLAELSSALEYVQSRARVRVFRPPDLERLAEEVRRLPFGLIKVSAGEVRGYRRGAVATSIHLAWATIRGEKDVMGVVRRDDSYAITPKMSASRERVLALLASWGHRASEEVLRRTDSGVRRLLASRGLAAPNTGRYYLRSVRLAGSALAWVREWGEEYGYRYLCTPVRVIPTYDYRVEKVLVDAGWTKEDARRVEKMSREEVEAVEVLLCLERR